MKKLLSAAAVAALVLAPLSAWAGSSEWTGYITDSHCGKNGATKDHGAACVEKCVKGGSKAQIWNEADQKAYELDGFDKVKPLMGSKVTVSGTVDASNNTINVESARKAEDKKAK